MKIINRWLTLALFISPLLSAAELQLADTYEDVNHKPVSLKSVIGHQPVYIKFWASWCLDCRREFPSLENTYQKYRDQLAMFAVNLNINETDEEVQAILQKVKLTIPVIYDNNGSLASNFNFKGTPFHVLIDAKGNVVYTTYKDDAALAEKLDQLAKTSTITGSKVTLKNTSLNEKSDLPKGVSLVFFSAAWCDTYMKDVQQEISKNCAGATSTVDKIFHAKPAPQLQAFVTYLWTEEKDVAEYKKRLAIPYAVKMDQNNEHFQRYHATQYPTLLIFKDGKELKRFTDFAKPEQVAQTVSELLSVAK